MKEIVSFTLSIEINYETPEERQRYLHNAELIAKEYGAVLQKAMGMSQPTRVGPQVEQDSDGTH